MTGHSAVNEDERVIRSCRLRESEVVVVSERLFGKYDRAELEEPLPRPFLKSRKLFVSGVEQLQSKRTKRIFQVF